MVISPAGWSPRQAASPRWTKLAALRQAAPGVARCGLFCARRLLLSVVHLLINVSNDRLLKMLIFLLYMLILVGFCVIQLVYCRVFAGHSGLISSHSRSRVMALSSLIKNLINPSLLTLVVYSLGNAGDVVRLKV